MEVYVLSFNTHFCYYKYAKKILIYLPYKLNSMTSLQAI